jgi:hypothetical protein
MQGLSRTAIRVRTGVVGPSSPLRAAVATVVVCAAVPGLFAAPELTRSQERGTSPPRADVVVFGATPAGVTAAVAAARAVEANTSVQAVAYPALRRRFLDGGLRLAP